ncbi:MAG TPA: hypothetical protein VES36_08835 [Candidatus Limnocylindrales bacterium]|nr:hypothetical protein [Candidatus Limnocylindrales bacterium]
MTPLPRRIAAVGTLLLAGAIVAVLTLRSLGVPLATAPMGSPTPPLALPTAGTPSPSASEDALDVFARIEQQVSDLRGLPSPEIGPPDVLTRRELVVELRAILDETWTDAQLARDNLTLRALGLLTDEQDIRELTELLYAGQVLGFYDFEERRMVVVTDAGITPEAQVTYAHEFTHAMQDAAFHTGRAHQVEGEDDDAALARLALEEGDASVAMVQWATQNLSPEQLVGIATTPLPDTGGVPQWMIRQLEFPYLSGAQLISQLWAAGGWDAVDSAYDDPPASTEQVLHPDKFRDREPPVKLADPGLADQLGPGWKDVESITIGEAMLDIWLQELGINNTDAAAASEGWGGDRLSVARGPDGEWVLAWRMAWDAAGEATEFATIRGQATATLPFATAVDRPSDTETLVLHASSATLLNRVEALLAD